MTRIDLVGVVLVAAMFAYAVWINVDGWFSSHVVGVSDPDGGYEIAGDRWDQLRELTPLLGIAAGLGAVVGAAVVYLARLVGLRRRLKEQIEARVRKREKDAQRREEAAVARERAAEDRIIGEHEQAQREIQKAQASMQAAEARAERAERRAAEAERKKKGAEHAYRRLYNRLQRTRTEKERP